MGRRLPDRGGPGRARGPRAARRLPPARVPPARRRRRSRSRPRVPSCIPACVALVAHPDDERYQPLFGTDGAHAAVRRRGARARPPAGRPRQGHRHRHDLHVRRPHRRHLVARAAAADPRDHRSRRADPAPTPPAGHRRRRRAQAAYARLAGSTAFTGARRRSSSCCASPATWSASRAPITHPVKFYEKGDRPLEIVTVAAVVHPQRRPRRATCASACSRAAASCTGTRRTCGRATRTGSRASTATG